jgi:hypothetical protein
MDVATDNINTLKAMIPAPCLGVVPWLTGNEKPETYLDVTPLLFD